jgi:hypothetical protein
MDRSDTAPSQTIQCDICNRTYNIRGFANHRRACETKKIEALQVQERIDQAAGIARAKRSKSYSNILFNIE